MAVRFQSSDSDSLRQAAYINFNSAYTVCGWFRWQNLPSQAWAFHICSDDGLYYWGNADALLLSSGELCVIATKNEDYALSTLQSISTDTWYHVAMVRADSGELKLYVDGVDTGSASLDITGRTATGYMAIGAQFNGSTTPSNWFSDIDVEGLNMWQRALSAAEIASQSRAHRPLSASSLLSFHPFYDENFGDLSGNAHTWTEANSVTLVQGPPIPFGMPVVSVPAITAGGGGSGTTVTPTTASLTITTFAPTVSTSDNKTVTPSTLALTTSTFAPTVTASDHKTATPTTLELTTSTFAPTVTATDNKTATPTTASLTISTFAPTVTASGNQTVTPTTLELVTSTFAPTVTASDHKTATPTTLALVTSTFAPTVTVTGSQLVTPTTLALIITTYAPTVTGSASPVITYGTWNEGEIEIAAGSEWRVVLTGASVDTPSARVAVRLCAQ